MSSGKKTQHFGTLDLIFLVVLCGTVSSVVGASFAGLLHDDRPSRAHAAAMTLADQLRQEHELTLAAFQSGGKTNRSPASLSDAGLPPFTDGQIGKDPWGHPYSYTVLGLPGDPTPTIAVWSNGPNGKLESKIEEFNELGAQKFHFHGDDVGYVSDGRSAIPDLRRSR